ncbi:MAG: hypothetical protein MdMp014T_0141 [Treponematales bacterium]
MDYEKVFEKVKGQGGFIKTTKKPAVPDEMKAVLNRRGNTLFNSGDIEGAKRVFLTTGYSDGLARVGDYYKSRGRELDALKMYWIAPDRKKADALIEKASLVIRDLLNKEKGGADER